MAELERRMAEARRTVETGILYLSTLRGNGERWVIERASGCEGG